MVLFKLPSFSLQKVALSRPAGLFVAMVLSAWVSFHWFGGVSGFLDIWPCNAIALAIALPAWRRSQSRLRLPFASAAGCFVAAELAGLPHFAGAWLAVVGGLQLWATCSILSFSIATFEDLKFVWNAVRFIVIALVAAAGGAALVVRPLTAAQGTPLLATWYHLMQVDSMGILTIFPAGLFLTSGKFRSFKLLRPHLASSIFWAVFFSIACFGVFYQTHLPLLFLVFPPLVGVVLAMGSEGAALSLLIVTVTGGSLTELGDGPISLIQNPSRDVHAFVFQVFLMAVVAVALPVGALLDERRRSARAEKEAQSINTTLLKHAQDIVILASFAGQRRFVSPSVLKVSGWTEKEFLRQGKHGPIHPKDREIVEAMQTRIEEGEDSTNARYRMLCKDGGYRWVEATAIGYKQPNSRRTEGYVATVRDISSQMEMELAWNAERAAMARENSRLGDLAWKDELTGLANRRSFNQLLAFEKARKDRSNAPLSMLLIDVDYFKDFNDILGHPAGDRCLQEIGHALRSASSRATDTPARIGGEEFAIILAATDAEGAALVGRKVRDAVAELDIDHPGSPLKKLTVSIGAATIPAGYESETDALIQAADLALYEGKQSGRDRVVAGPAVGLLRLKTPACEP